MLGKMSDLDTMSEKIMKSGHDVGQPEVKRRDRIWARCQKTRNKKKGSNHGTMSENPKQKEGVESRHDAGEPEMKREGIESGCDAGEADTKGRD